MYESSCTKFAPICFLIVLLPTLGGCWGFYLGPPQDEYPLDLALEPDGTAVLSTSRGKLLGTDDQGRNWNDIFFFDEVANIFSGSIEKLTITEDGIYFGLYRAPAGRRFTLIVPNISLVVSCDGATSFDLLEISQDSYYYDSRIIPQPNALPLVLAGGKLYELTSTGTCPNRLREWGNPNPTGNVESVAVCGDIVYQASSSRIFSTNDRGENWTPIWDFFVYGTVHLACDDRDNVWAWNTGTGEVIKRASGSLEFFEVGSLSDRFNVYDTNFSLARQGLFFVAGREPGILAIYAIDQVGAVHEFPSVPLDDYDGEYLQDFEIAPDGVFWVTTTRAVYRDDVNEVWTKVWP
jgi:hypothetical protein